MYGLTKRIDLMCTCISTAQFDKKLLFWVLIFCQGKHKNIYFITKNGKGLILDKSAYTQLYSENIPQKKSVYSQIFLPGLMFQNNSQHSALFLHLILCLLVKNTTALSH